MAPSRALPFETAQDVERVLGREGYLADRGLSTAILLALKMGRPLLLEGKNVLIAA